jgi:hypothetical protein
MMGSDHMRTLPPLHRLAAASAALLILASVVVVVTSAPASAQTVPPLVVENTAEGGTDGTVVTIENSGGASGRPWDVIRPTRDSNPNRFVYRSAGALKGTMSYDLTTAGTGQALLAWWFWANNGTIEQPIAYTRFYARFPSAPAGNVRIYRLREPGGHDVMALQVVASTRKVRLFDSDNTVVWVSQSAVPVNATFRVEAYWDWQARRAEVRLYLTNPDAAVNSFTESSGTVTSNFGTRDIDEAAYGNPLSTADFGTLLLDDLGFSNQGWMGPSSSTPPPPPPPSDPGVLTNTAEGGANGTAVTTANSGGASGDPWDFVTRATNTNRFVYRSTGALKGSRSYELATAGTGQAYLAWWFNATTGRGDQPVLFTRFYGRFPSAPSGNVRLLRLRDPTGAALMSVYIPGKTKRFQLRNGSNQVVWTSNNQVPSNATFRIEVRWDRVAGQAELRLFLSNPDAAAGSFTESSGTVSGSWINRTVAEVAYGNAGSTSNFGTLLLDDLGVSDQEWLGPTSG